MSPFFELALPSQLTFFELTLPSQLTKSELTARSTNSFSQFFSVFFNFFCDFDGFAKLHPSTMKFRQTIGFAKPSWILSKKLKI